MAFPRLVLFRIESFSGRSEGAPLRDGLSAVESTGRASPEKPRPQREMLPTRTIPGRETMGCLVRLAGSLLLLLALAILARRVLESPGLIPPPGTGERDTVV